MAPKRTILHPTDFSKPARWAFGLACCLARKHDSRLIVLHVAPPPFYGMALLQQAEYEGLWDDLCQLQAPDFAVRVEHRLRHGDRLTQILRVAREIECDLMVIGSHPRSRLRRLFRRPFAERLAGRAPCPALAVQTPVPERLPALATQASAPFPGSGSRVLVAGGR